jgi:SAM-dependent methyltransferase
MADSDMALADLRRVYAARERETSDPWVPTNSDFELWHRVRLLIETCRALRLIPRQMESMRILDVGCGSGRSSRMLVDLGARPENITGLDIRHSIINVARKLNPAINFRWIESLADWPADSFDLVVQATAFSSIPDAAVRLQTAALMEQSVGDNGFVLWWDGVATNQFAGREVLDPRRFFPSRQMLLYKRVPLPPYLDECLWGLGPYVRYAARIFRIMTHKTHCIALFGPRC